MSKLLGEHAVVIGGSIAGLATARVLADHFEQVTVLERDHIAEEPAIHKSIPQGNHLHNLLLGGQRVFSRLYPGFTEKLQNLGAVRLRWGMDNVFLLPDGKAYSRGGAVREPHDLGIDIYCQSRGLLEYCVRQCTKKSANISLQSDCTARGLIGGKSHVTGVAYDHDGESHSIVSDFVVDAAGRGSHAPRWIRQLGFAPPEETSIGVDFAYTSAKYRIPNYSEPERVMAVLAPGPDHPNMGILEEIEGNVFHVSLGGRFGDYPPDDEQGFLGFAKSLHTSKLYDVLKDAERASEITTHRFPTSLRRHYERLAGFPERFVVLGDAISSFNPIYAQGMSSAALQVRALQNLLNERSQQRTPLDGLAPAFFAQAAEIVTVPWMLAANADFAFPQTTGERPPELEAGARYFVALDALCAEDVQLQILVTEVVNLAKPLTALSEEPLRSRVLTRMRRLDADGRRTTQQ
jgi:2-polyprenyl-6-methoxyphenol hydroxylase-like FAD-dependent oxidoreductase